VTHSNRLSKEADVKVIFGSLEKLSEPSRFFEETTITFLDKVSQSILSDQSIREYGDLVSFGYWCRRSNLNNLKLNYNESQLRVGLGETFHIAPSNVPINFAFSLAFALLAGNTCTVRVPTREFPQVEKLCKIFEIVTEDPVLKEFRYRIAIIRYPHSDETTQYFSTLANARLIWGGDETVQYIRKIPSSMRSLDLTFSDRYSLAIFSAKHILQLEERELKILGGAFYNDVYLFDQNACSSPRLIVWNGEGSELVEAQKYFWRIVGDIVHEKYPIQASHTSAKFLELCNIAINDLPIINWKRDENQIEHITLKNLTPKIIDVENRFGMFFEYSLTNLRDLADLIEPKVQTITYYGFEKGDLVGLVPELFLKGVDRVVPVGQALNIGPIWDGYDVPLMLSRIIDVQ